MSAPAAAQTYRLRRRRSPRPGRSLLAVGVAAMLLVGCTTPGAFVQSTSKFATATVALVGASEAYFAEADHVDLDTALVWAEFSGRPIPKAMLGHAFFPPEDMAARRALLAAMQAYASALSCLAEGRMGEDLQSAVGQFRANLLSFEAHLQEVSGNSRLMALQSDSAFLTDVVGALGGAWIEQTQADALAEAILRADPPMRAAADLLQADVALMSAKLREARALEFAVAVDGVNPLLPAASLERRTSLAGAVRPYSEKFLESRALGAGFDAALASYRTAQAEMTTFARGLRLAGRDPGNIPHMVAAVDQFTLRARALLALMQRGPQPVSSLTEESVR